MNYTALKTAHLYDTGNRDTATPPAPDAPPAESEKAIVEILRNRPRTSQQVIHELGLDPIAGLKRLNLLCQEQRIERRRAGNKVIYRAVD